MTLQEKKKLIENAAEELKCMIDIVNNDFDEAGHYNYKTCYELMVIAKELS